MRWCALLVMVLGAAACSSADSAASSGRRANNPDRPREPVGEAMPHEECVGRGREVVSQDVNRDGRPDIRTVMEGGRPRCREIDANFDGRVDVYRWFDLATGQTTRVEDDYDFDGRIDLVALYENGVVVRDILDTNFDGRTDTWREYRNGRLVELRRDADGDGRVDTWERYDADGRLVYVAHDNNRDGEPDPEPGASDAGAVTGVVTSSASDASVVTSSASDAGVVTGAVTSSAATPAAPTPSVTSTSTSQEAP